jgi:hypothetical protein
MPFFTPQKTLRKKRHRANRSARPAPTSCRHGPCDGRCPIIGNYRTLPLPPPSSASTCRENPSGSALHNESLCKLPPTPSPTPPRSRVADRPEHREPAPRSWVPWSRFRGCRRSTWPPSRTALRAVRRFAGNARQRAQTGRSRPTLGAGCLVLSSRLCGIRGFPRCIPARTPPPLRLRLRSGGSQFDNFPLPVYFYVKEYVLGGSYVYQADPQT